MSFNYQTGYVPVQYNSNAGFWGTLFDDSWCPSELFCRLADALYFFLDRNMGAYRNTGSIEPDKMTLWSVAIGTPAHDMPTEAQLKSMYDAGQIPYRMVFINGISTPVLDRQAWLQASVCEFRADPTHAVQEWNKSIATFALCDPMTGQLFPGPIPRTAVPMFPHAPSALGLAQWQHSIQLERQ